MKTLYLHVGPPKTGTTAIQHSMINAKERLLAEAHIEYLTDEHKPHALHATLDLINSETLNQRDSQHIQTKPGAWERLKAKVLRSNANSLFISSEALAAYNLQHISKLRSEIGPMHVHLILTFRPLLELIPSQWQQWVRIGDKRGLGQFVEEIIQEYNQSLPSYFWNMHDVARVTKRWIEGLSPNHVSLIVAEKAHPELILRRFEQVLGIRVPLLELAGSNNPALSLEETFFLQEVTQGLETKSNIANWAYLSTVALNKSERPLSRQQADSLHQLRVSADKIDHIELIQHKILAELNATGSTVLGQAAGDVRATHASPDAMSDETQQALQAAARITVHMLTSTAKAAKQSVKKKIVKTRGRPIFGYKHGWLYAVKKLVPRRKE